MSGSWGERTPCLVTPPDILLSIADQLSAIADAFEDGDAASVRDQVRCLDLEACRRHWIACAAEAEVRFRALELLRPGDMAKRRVTDRTRLRLAGRDGWRCRYCSIPLVWNGFFDALWMVDGLDFGSAVNDLWRVFCLSPDHVLPIARGGSTCTENLVSACGSCNYARSDSLLEEIGIADPFSRDCARTSWEGLVGRPHLGPLG